LPIVLGEDDPIACQAVGVRPFTEAVNDDPVRYRSRPHVGIVTALFSYLAQGSVEGRIPLAPGDVPSLADIPQHVARREEMFVPEGKQRRMLELLPLATLDGSRGC
jgi:hypothetical protein